MLFAYEPGQPVLRDISLIIAHRLATVRHCDRILVLKDGVIAQDGTYDELLSQPGTFQQLVQGQALRH